MSNEWSKHVELISNTCQTYIWNIHGTFVKLKAFLKHPQAIIRQAWSNPDISSSSTYSDTRLKITSYLPVKTMFILPQVLPRKIHVQRCVIGRNCCSTTERTRCKCDSWCKHNIKKGGSRAQALLNICSTNGWEHEEILVFDEESNVQLYSAAKVSLF